MIYYYMIIGAIIGASLGKIWQTYRISRLVYLTSQTTSPHIRLAELQLLRKLL